MSSTTDDSRMSSATAVVTRVFDAPREAIWDAWTIPSRFAAWFATPPFVTPVESVHMDVRPGGRWGAVQVSEADGLELPFLGTYREVEPPERLVFTFEDPADPANPNSEVATVTLRAVPSGTEVTMRQAGHLPAEEYPRLEEGYARFFDRLGELLAKA